MAKLAKLPPATICAFVHDERPSIFLMRSLVRDIRGWPALEVWDSTKESFQPRSRSTQATRFLEQGVGDVLVMVDHDIGWDYGSLHHLVRSCYEVQSVVGGIYSYRAFGGGMVVRLPPGQSFQIGQERLVPVPYVPTGFMAIHRKVLERLARDLPVTIHGYRSFFGTFARQHANGGGTEELTEDFAFCARAGDAGFLIYADLRPRLVHHGTHPFRPVDSTFDLPPEQDILIRAVDYGSPQPLKAGGAVFVDSADKFVGAAVLKRGEWEPEVVEAVKAHADEGKTLLEIGAHIGVHTVQLAPLFGKVIAIEPMPHNFDLLTRNMNVNQATNVEMWRAAIGDRKGKARMMRDYQNSGACQLSPDGAGVEVDMTTIKALLDGTGFDVVKLDAEGAEDLIVKANPELLRCPVIVTEYCDGQLRRVSGTPGPDYVRRLKAAGYRLHNIRGEVLDEHTLPTGMAYTNIVAVKDRGGPLNL